MGGSYSLEDCGKAESRIRISYYALESSRQTATYLADRIITVEFK